jgi:putative Mg2+ transporter-C (MgtC) family protein
MWHDLAQHFYLNGDVFVRLLLTVVAGFLLGLERERHGRAAGLKTTMLVTLSACMVMLVSEFYYVKTFDMLGEDVNSWRPDPTRLAAGALSGMGFLGAGVIVHERANVVRGVTTAATLWLSTAVGMCFGAGLHGIGVLCTLVAIFILFVLPLIEDLVQDDWFTDFTVVLDSRECSLEDLMARIREAGVKISSIDLRSVHATGEQKATFHIKHKKNQLQGLALGLTKRIGALPGVKETHWID